MCSAICSTLKLDLSSATTLSVSGTHEWNDTFDTFSSKNAFVEKRPCAAVVRTTCTQAAVTMSLLGSDGHRNTSMMSETR